MHIVLREQGDLDELERRIRTETNAKQRDRYRAVRLARDERQTRTIQMMLGRSKDFVQRWCYIYRDHGIDAVVPRKQTEYEWCYVFGAVNPLTGNSSAIVAPTVNTQYMNQHLRFISETAGPDTHVVLVLDNAGWHVAKALSPPPNITLLRLAPYSPELNPIERIWAYLKSHHTSNRVFADYDELFAVLCQTWNALDADRLTLADPNRVDHARESSGMSIIALLAAAALSMRRSALKAFDDVCDRDGIIRQDSRHGQPSPAAWWSFAASAAYSP